MAATGGVPLTPTGAVAADGFLLLGVHADHRVTSVEEGRAGVDETPELGVTIRVLGALVLLGGALQ